LLSDYYVLILLISLRSIGTKDFKISRLCEEPDPRLWIRSYQKFLSSYVILVAEKTDGLTVLETQCLDAARAEIKRELPDNVVKSVWRRRRKIQ